MRIDTYSLLILADNGHEMRCDLFIGGFPEGKRNQRKGEEEGLLDDRQCLSLESDQKATINGESEHLRKETAVQFAVVAHLVDDGTELGGKGVKRNGQLLRLRDVLVCFFRQVAVHEKQNIGGAAQFEVKELFFLLRMMFR